MPSQLGSMSVLVLICPIILHCQSYAFLKCRELKPRQQVLKALIAHALSMLSVSLGRIKDDLTILKLHGYGASKICNGVLFLW